MNTINRSMKTTWCKQVFIAISAILITYAANAQQKAHKRSQVLTIGDIKGAYPGYVKTRVFRIVFVREDNGIGTEEGMAKRSVVYSGKKIAIKLM